MVWMLHEAMVLLALADFQPSYILKDGREMGFHGSSFARGSMSMCTALPELAWRKTVESDKRVRENVGGLTKPPGSLIIRAPARHCPPNSKDESGQQGQRQTTATLIRRCRTGNHGE